MYDPAQQTWLIVAAPPPGFMYTDPIALQARTEPNATPPTAVDPVLAAQNLALIEVRSVYDTDGLNRMGEQMLTAADLPAGCTQGIALTAPTDTLDTRAQVADLVRMKDPADPAYNCAPARFVRAARAVAPPSSMMGLRSAIGETEFEQQQILGYAPVEPDGSFKLQIPADMPIALSIVDSKGRAFQTHTNWIQVRPGERRTCDGCHSPRRGGALNSGTVVNTMPAALRPALAGAAPVRRDDGRRRARASTLLRCRCCATRSSPTCGPTPRKPASLRVRRSRSATPATRTRPTTWPRRRRSTASSTTRTTSSRCGRATAARTPAPAATPTRPSSTCAARPRAPAASRRTKSC